MVFREKGSTSREKVGFQSISSHFWDQQQESPASLNCLVRSLPGEPVPFVERLPSGLNRSQQLLLAQRLADVPFVPSYASRSGGLVLDRVLACIGTPKWWLGITTRLKAQRLWQQHKNREGHENIGRRLIDASNYALAAFVKAKPTRSTSLVYTGEVGSVEDLIRGESFKVDSLSPRRSSWIFRQNLPGHELCAKILENERFMDSSSSYIDIPRVASIHLTTRSKCSGLHYAAGMHKVSAPDCPVERAKGDSPLGHNFSSLFHSTHTQVMMAYDRRGRIWAPKDTRGADEGKCYDDITTDIGIESEFNMEEGGRRKIFSSAPFSPGRKKRPYSGISPKQGLVVSGMFGAIARLPSSALSSKADLTTREKMKSVMRHVSTRALCSLGLSFQMGQFKRVMFDYTAMHFRLDMSTSAAQRAGRCLHSLSSSEDQPENGIQAEAIELHPAFKLENFSRNQALTFSLCQQLYGPVRFCVDARCGLNFLPAASRKGEQVNSQEGDRTTFMQKAGAFLRPLDMREGLRHLTKMGPEIYEVLYGIDVPIPSAYGAVRLAAWYSPLRKEALAEVRLLDL